MIVHEQIKQVRTRSMIREEIDHKRELIDKIRGEINALNKEDILLCDEDQKFTEVEEDVVVSRRPKKVERKLIGRIHWKEGFKDEDSNETVWIERCQVVRIDGKWI